MAEADGSAPTDHVVRDDPSPEEQIRRHLAQTRPFMGVYTVLFGLATAFFTCAGAVEHESLFSIRDQVFPVEDSTRSGGISGCSTC